MKSNTIEFIRKTPIVVAIGILIFLTAPLFNALFLGLVFACLGWNLEDFLHLRLSLSSRIARILAPILIFLTGLVLLGLSIGTSILIYKLASVSLNENHLKELLKSFEGSNFFGELNSLSEEMKIGKLTDHYKNFVQSLLEITSRMLSYLASNLPRLFVGVFIGSVVFANVYFSHSFLTQFRDSQNILSPRFLRYLGESLRRYSYSTFFATLVCALSQGLVIFLGSILSGVSKSALWGAIATICALFPYVGTAPVSLALTIYLYAIQGLSGSFWIMMAFGIFASLIDNILRPLLLNGGKRPSPLMAFLAIFGGLYALGPIGIFIGPILAGIALDLLEYKWHEDQNLDF